MTLVLGQTQIECICKPYNSADICRMPLLFNFRDFEFVHGVFQLPENIYIFRSVHPDRPLPPHAPTFFGDHEVARSYHHGRTLKAFTQKERIRVIDMRYVQAILPYLWSCINPTRTDLEIIKATSIALGLVSFQKQVQLLKDMNTPILDPMIQRMESFAQLPQKPAWVNPVEMQGVRCGITDMDYFVIGFLKELFSGIADGIIAPALPTPFHSQISQDVRTSMMYQELILFDPSESVQEVVTESNSLTIQGVTDAKTYIGSLMRVATPVTRRTRVSLIQRGGKPTESNAVDEPRDVTAEKIAMGDVATIKAYSGFMRKAKPLAEKLKKTQTYLRYYCPNFCVIGSPIPSTVRIGQL